MKQLTKRFTFWVAMAVSSSLLAMTEKPNIVILYADDLGVADVSYGDPQAKIQTAHIDSSASPGMASPYGVGGFHSLDAKLTFYVNTPDADDYAVSIILATPEVQMMEFKCGDSVITTPAMMKEWRKG